MHAASILSHRARLTPEREALLDYHSGRRYCYRELNERACRAAHWLRSIGLGPGDRVALLAQNGMASIDLLYGVAKIGAVFTPLNWRLAAPELVYIVNDCTPKALIVGPEYLELYEQMRPQISVEHVFTVEGAQIAGAGSYEAALAAAPAEEPPLPPLTGEETHCILYTSGTTGKPKGAMIPQRMVQQNAINTVMSWGLDASDVSPILTPLFHAGGLFAFLVPVLYVGGRVILTRTFDPDESLKMIEEEGCTVILGVPTLFQMWQDSPQFELADFSRVKFFISGGAPCPPALMEHWRSRKGIIFRQGYGLTEVGTNCFSMTDEDSVPQTGSVGKPIFHSEMKLVNPDSGEEVDAGQPGELWIKGAHVCSGYWGRPDATAEAIVDGWFRTGDTAERNAEGFYRIIGRYKDMIKSGGENVYAAEVEAAFREHPAVQDAALIGVPHEKWGEVGLMVVVCQKGQQISAEELQQFCAERLARFKVPRLIVFADTLPYSPYGKVIKAELREKYGRPG